MKPWQVDVVGGFHLADGTELNAVSGIDDSSRFGVSERLPAGHPYRVATSECTVRQSAKCSCCRHGAQPDRGRAARAHQRGLRSQCISPGRRTATAQFASNDDIAKRLYIGGRVAAKIKESACDSW